MDESDEALSALGPFPRATTGFEILNDMFQDCQNLAEQLERTHVAFLHPSGIGAIQERHFSSSIHPLGNNADLGRRPNVRGDLWSNPYKTCYNDKGINRSLQHVDIELSPKLQNPMTEYVDGSYSCSEPIVSGHGLGIFDPYSGLTALGLMEPKMDNTPQLSQSTHLEMELGGTEAMSPTDHEESSATARSSMLRSDNAGIETWRQPWHEIMSRFGTQLWWANEAITPVDWDSASSGWTSDGFDTSDLVAENTSQSPSNDLGSAYYPFGVDPDFTVNTVNNAPPSDSSVFPRESSLSGLITPTEPRSRSAGTLPFSQSILLSSSLSLTENFARSITGISNLGRSQDNTNPGGLVEKSPPKLERVSPGMPDIHGTASELAVANMFHSGSGHAGAMSAPWEMISFHKPIAACLKGIPRWQRQSVPRQTPKREIRKETKPEKCPVCNKGHSYIKDVKRHIAAQHRDVAADYGVSTERHICRQCGKSYARKDHLVRHQRKCRRRIHWSTIAPAL